MTDSPGSQVGLPSASPAWRASTCRSPNTASSGTYIASPSSGRTGPLIGFVAPPSIRRASSARCWTPVKEASLLSRPRSLPDETVLPSRHKRAHHQVLRRRRSRRDSGLHARSGPVDGRWAAPDPPRAVRAGHDAVRMRAAPRFNYGAQPHDVSAVRDGVLFTTPSYRSISVPRRPW